MLKYWLALGLMLVAGCDQREKVAGPETSVKDLILEPTVDIGGGRPSIVIKTNLPDATSLQATLSQGDPGKQTYMAQADTTIFQGSGSFGPFSKNNARLPPGRYDLVISAPLSEVQPEPAREALGHDYRNYRSPAIKQRTKPGEMNGAYIEVKSTVMIPRD